MNLFNLFATIALDSSEYDSGIKKASKSGESLASKLGSGLAKAGKAAATGLAAIGTAAGGAVAGLLALESSTEEYRIAMGKLNTAFEAAGYDAEIAQEAYRGFYAILGDTDTATEASQLLAKLADSEEDVAVWTDIAAGVAGTFGDSLPIEGLIEAANETAKVGEVTGSLADALNWAGISEDDFNAKLEACTSESERNQLIMDTLSGTYDEASDAFYRNNETLVESRENQARLNDSLAKIGESVATVKNALLEQFAPAIETVSTKIADFIAGIDVEQVINSMQGLINGFVELSPVVAGATAAIVAYKAASAISGVIDALRVATEGQTIAQAALNAVMNANPFVLAATAIAGVVTAIITLWNTNEDFRAAVEPIWEAIKNIFSKAWEGIKAIWDKVQPYFQAIWDGIMSVFSVVADVLSQYFSLAWDGIQAVWNTVTGYFSNIWNTIKGIFSAVKAVLSGDFEGAWEAIKGVFSGWADFFEGLWDDLTGVFSKAWDFFTGIGENIVKGLWNGISNMVGWLGKQVGGFIDNVKGWFTGKRGFDEHSPSKWAERVGAYVAEGLANGIEEEADEAQKAAEQMAKNVYDGLKEWADRTVKYENTSLNDQLDMWEAIQSQFIEGSKQYLDAEEEIFDLRQEIREEEKKAQEEAIKKEEERQKKIEEINQTILDIEQEYQNALSSRTKEIFNAYDLFAQIPERQAVAGEELISNLEDQIATMEEFYTGLETLEERGIGGGLLDEIREMGPSAVDQLSALLALSDEKLSEYAALYAEKQELANSVAIEELEGLREETDRKIKENMDELEALYDQRAPVVGRAFSEGLANGIRNGMSLVSAAAESVAKAAETAVRADSMNFGTANVDFSTSGLGQSSAGMINGLSAAIRSGRPSGSSTLNLMFPDGTRLASYELPFLIDVSKANGTPIYTPT